MLHFGGGGGVSIPWSFLVATASKVYLPDFKKTHEFHVSNNCLTSNSILAQ
jgi:hypothetical protein